jgi:membrane-bound ClpP family serine protease
VELWVWSILLLVIGVVLVVAEIFVPSGALFGLLAFLSITGGILLAFMENSTTGFIMLAAALLGVPTAVVAALNWWPHTRMGKRFLLQVPTSEEVLPENDPRRRLQPLVGRVGRAKSMMLPSGMVMIENKTYDALSEGVAIEEGQRVRVIEVRGAWLVVEKVDESVPLSENDPDVLARPVDWEEPPPPASPPA